MRVLLCANMGCKFHLVFQKSVLSASSNMSLAKQCLSLTPVTVVLATCVLMGYTVSEVSSLVFSLHTSYGQEQSNVD